MSGLTAQDREFLDRLNEHYDGAIADILRRLQRVRPLDKLTMMSILMKAQKRYWAERIDMIDEYTLLTAERTAAALAIPYANAAKTFESRVRSIYANYKSAFGLSQKDAKELLKNARFDRSLSEMLRAAAEDMPEGAEKTRILAEISAPAYRYRLQRAGVMQRQAEDICAQIARGETAIVREFLQTDIERQANITWQEIGLREPAEAVVDMLSDSPDSPQQSGQGSQELPAVRQSAEVAAPAPVQEFTPTSDAAVAPSLTLISPERVQHIIGYDWDGRNFSERIWRNTEELARSVKEVLLEGELTGASEVDMAAKIRDKFDTSMYKARRVVRTEHTYSCAQTELASLKDAGFEEYQFYSLHEERDCDHCDALDGQVFRIEDAAPGINLPPIHPFCRCAIGAKFVTPEELEAEIDRMLEETPIEELERRLDEQIAATENPVSGVDKSEKSDIIEVGNEEIKSIRSSGTGGDFVDNWYEEVGKIDISDREQIDRILFDFEQKHADSQEEHCVVITKTGIIYEVHGSRWSVDTTLLGDKMNGSINKHNHVTGESQYSFSYQDILSSAIDGSKESWAFDEKYDYFTAFRKNVDENDVYNAYESATLNVLERKLNGECISDEDEQHEIVKATCSKLGIEYERWLK